MPLLGFEPAILLLERSMTLVALTRENTESKYCAQYGIHYADTLELCAETVHAVVDIKLEM
jgi:hypothetical protein